jgi:hypothetical protein
MIRQTGKVRWPAIAAGVIIVLTVVIFLPSYSYVSQSRQAGSELWSRTHELRSEIEDRVKKSSGVDGSGLALKAGVSEETKFGRVEISVDSNGKITARNIKFDQELSAFPVVRDGSIEWQCKGTPPKDMSPWCR